MTNDELFDAFERASHKLSVAHFNYDGSERKLQDIERAEVLANAARAAVLARMTPGWQDESTAPPSKMLVTYRLGEEHVTRAALRIWPDGTREWIDPVGRTTVTHHSYAAPTHWLCEAPNLPATPSRPA